MKDVKDESLNVTGEKLKRNQIDCSIKKQRHIYNSLFEKAQSNYVSSFFDNCLNSKSLWQSINKVLHRSNPSQQIPPAIYSANQFSSFFSEKIKTFRLNLPLININPFSVPEKSPLIFSSFKSASFDEIKQLILSSPKSTCQSDPILSNLLPHCIDSIVPIATRIVNVSLNTGIFPNECKSAFVKPLKKTNLWIQMI